MMTIAVNIALNVSGLLFIIFMMVVYFSKKNMNNIDNTLFRLMLISNFFNSFIHLLYLLVEWYNPTMFNLVDVLVRGYWIPEQFYVVCLISYIFITLRGSEDGLIRNLFSDKKKTYKILSIGFILVFILFAFVPCTFIYEDNLVKGFQGPAIIVFYIPIVLLLIFNILAIILYRNRENKQKIMPFKFLLIFMVVGFTLASIYPMLCVTEFLVTCISYLMFHTIENPDLKLVNELTLAKNEAEKASNAKSEFLSSMSHELRTPLNAIVGLSTMIKEEESREEINKDADDILKASNNLLELVDGILDINKLESNNMEIVNSSYNPRDLFNSIEKTTNIRIGDKPIEFRSRISEDLPLYLMGDKNKIKTIINNLISNAVKYTEKGHVDFNVDCVNNNGKCNLRFTISDTGRGIRDDQKQYLFQKFYRLEEDKDSDIEGTGLGLSITKSLVELIGGEINVNSTEGMGTTFMVTINQDIVDNNQSIDETELL